MNFVHVHCAEAMAASELMTIIRANAGAPGLAIILSCDYKKLPYLTNMEGAEGDGIRMEETMKGLGYAVKRMHNVTRGQLLNVVCDAAEKVVYPPSFRRLMFVFSGHGKDESLITNEGEKVAVLGEIVRRLSPGRWAQSPLKDMVRLFIIDACRGDMDDEGITVPKGGSSVDSIRIPSSEGNLLIAYSTVQGFHAYEESGLGGLWLPLVAEELKSDCEVQIVFTRVNMKLRHKLQDRKYEYVQQPETIARLNEIVNLAREVPGLCSLIIHVVCTNVICSWLYPFKCARFNRSDISKIKRSEFVCCRQLRRKTVF